MTQRQLGPAGHFYMIDRNVQARPRVVRSTARANKIHPKKKSLHVPFSEGSSSFWLFSRSTTTPASPCLSGHRHEFNSLGRTGILCRYWVFQQCPSQQKSSFQYMAFFITNGRIKPPQNSVQPFLRKTKSSLGFLYKQITDDRSSVK